MTLPKGLQVKQIIEGEFGDVNPDPDGWRPFVQRRNGEYVIRDSYFFHMHRSAETHVQRVRDAFTRAGMKIEVVSSQDVLRVWPKISYFECVFKVTSNADSQ